MDRDGWMTLLDLDEDEVPRLLILEGTWWRQKALDTRLPLLEEGVFKPWIHNKKKAWDKRYDPPKTTDGTRPTSTSTTAGKRAATVRPSLAKGEGEAAAPEPAETKPLAKPVD